MKFNRIGKNHFDWMTPACLH